MNTIFPPPPRATMCRATCWLIGNPPASVPCDHLVEGLGVVVEEVAAAGVGGVADQDVEPPERLDGTRRRSRRRTSCSKASPSTSTACRPRPRISATTASACGGALAVVDRDVRPGPGELEGDTPADPPPRPSPVPSCPAVSSSSRPRGDCRRPAKTHERLCGHEEPRRRHPRRPRSRDGSRPMISGGPPPRRAPPRVRAGGVSPRGPAAT